MHSSIFDEIWKQVTLPIRLASFGLRKEPHYVAAAFVSSCNTTRSLCEELLDQLALTFPGEAKQGIL